MSEKNNLFIVHLIELFILLLISLSANTKFLKLCRSKMKLKKALVTGGTSGIGLALCEKLLAMDYEVYSVSRNPNKN